MPSVFLPLPFSCMSGNSQLYRYWFCKQGGHLRNCGILSYPVLPPSFSPPVFHQFFHHFFPPFFPTCLFEVKISKRTFSPFFHHPGGTRWKIKSHLVKKQARGFSPSTGDQVSKIPRGKLMGSIFHHANFHHGQNFTTPGAKFRQQSRRRTRHKSRKISHQVSLHFSPQDSPQDFATRFATSFTTNSLEDSPLDFATRFAKLQGRPLAACGGSCLRMAAETPTDGDS